MRNKKILFLSLAAILLLVAGITWLKQLELSQTYYKAPFPYSDGFSAKLPIPKGSSHVKDYGMTYSQFKTNLSRAEVQAFYNNYINSLQLVHGKEDAGKTGFYDKGQRIVIIKIDFSLVNNKTNFTIHYDAFSEDNWVLNKPTRETTVR